MLAASAFRGVALANAAGSKVLCEEETHGRIAMDQLYKEIAHFGWSLETLRIWSDSDFRCVYCDRDMLESLDSNQLGVLDHFAATESIPTLGQ